MLFDGRIIGRAEPFAKVFSSSRDVKGRSAGPRGSSSKTPPSTSRGRLVADTTVRQIAAHLGLNKSTVARHLARLRDYGFVLHEEARDASGRWNTSRYVLDPSACVERFTHTPPADQPSLPPCPALDDPVDSTDATVSAFTGHGATGHGETDRLLMLTAALARFARSAVVETVAHDFD